MKILIVDDEPVSNYILGRLLRTLNATVDIIEFTRPKEAYQSLTTTNPDIIFLDLNMPEMNGWQFLDTMRADKLPYRVFVVTSSTSIVDIEKSKEYSSVIDCLAKPVTKEKLKECLDHLAR